jgi:hypothetical protein
MPSAGKQASLFDAVRRLIRDEGVTTAIFATVVAASILAFGFGATADIVASMLILGTVTAFAEARLRK